MIRHSVPAEIALATLLIGAAVALGAGWLGGTGAALGVILGTGLAVLNFLWLVRGVMRPHVDTRRRSWMLASSLRMLALTGAFAAVLALRLVHPVALVIGLTALPCALVVRGLRAAREA
jgi:ATP synthase I subunit